MTSDDLSSQCDAGIPNRDAGSKLGRQAHHVEDPLSISSPVFSITIRQRITASTTSTHNKENWSFNTSSKITELYFCINLVHTGASRRVIVVMLYPFIWSYNRYPGPQYLVTIDLIFRYEIYTLDA